MAKKRCVTNEQFEEIKKKEKELKNKVKGGQASKAFLTEMAEDTTSITEQVTEVKKEAKKKWVEITLTGVLPILVPSKSYKLINTPEIFDEKKKKFTNPWLGPTIFLQGEGTITGNYAEGGPYLQKYNSYRTAILNGLPTLESNGFDTPTNDKDQKYIVGSEGERVRIRWTILIEDENVEKDLQEEMDKLIKSKDDHPGFNTLANEIIEDFAEFIPEVEATIAKLRQEYGIAKPPPAPPVSSVPATNVPGVPGINALPGIGEDLASIADAASLVSSFASNPELAAANIIAGAIQNQGISTPDLSLGGLIGAATGGINLSADDLVGQITAENPLAFTNTTPINAVDLCKVLPEKKITKVVTGGKATGEKIPEDPPKQIKQASTEQTQTTSIVQEKTVDVPTESPVSTVAPEAAVVIPETKEVKPITKSYEELKTEIDEVLENIITVYIDSVIGPFGNMTLESPKDFPDFEKEYFIDNSRETGLRAWKQRTFFKTDQYKRIRKLFKEYRNEDEGITKRKRLETRQVRIFDFLDDIDGIEDGDEEFLRSFQKVELETDRVKNERDFFATLLSDYISRLADSGMGKNSVGDIPVMGDIKIPTHHMESKQYVFKPTKFIGTPSSSATKHPEYEWRNTPEGRFENQLYNKFTIDTAYAWIVPSSFGPPYTYLSLETTRATNFFSIVLSEAMLIAQENRELFVQYTQLTGESYPRLFPPHYDWKNYLDNWPRSK